MGKAGERFCVRNSGAKVVVESIGDHGAEYMTGGRLVVLGEIGRNFAAGMSGGVAYIYDPAGEFLTRCNLGTVELEKVETAGDKSELHNLIHLHHKFTGSTIASKILASWPDVLKHFVKVMPTDYKRVLAERKKHDEESESKVHV